MTIEQIVTFTVAIIIVIAYCSTATYVAINVAKNQKKELTEQYEESISKIGGLSLSQAIEIEMLHETVKQLRFNHMAYSEYRKDTVQICADYREEINQLTEKLNTAQFKANFRKDLNNTLAKEMIALTKSQPDRDSKRRFTTKKS